MSTSSQLCTMPAEAQQDIKAFARKCSRAKEPLAIIYRVDPVSTTWHFVSRHEPVTMEELTDELEVNSPRFVLLIYPYQNDDGRFVCPLVAIHYIPKNVSPATKMLVTMAKDQFDSLVAPWTTVPMNEDDLEDGLLTDRERWIKVISTK